jgi:dihydroorotate dehydrogenase subfamily 2
MYSLLRKALFQLDPEDAHNAALKGLSLLKRCGLSCLASSSIKIKTTPVQVAGLTFSNRVGLAAGMDKNGDYIDEFGSLGFGFIEVGTITPRPQPGNPRPRMFRLPAAEAVINRMGFNNKGVEHLVANLKKRRFQGIVGVNIGKNFDTPLESAYKDYVFCLEAVYDYCDYITVNISSPNTKGLRDLQGDKHLSGLLEAISGARTAMTERGKVIRPVFLKIAPDLTNEDIAGVVSLVETHKIDGIIATNTTISRTAVSHLPHGDEAGGT